MTYSDLVSNRNKDKDKDKKCAWSKRERDWVTQTEDYTEMWTVAISENIYMRSSNCWHWKLLSYHVSPNNWFVVLNMPVKLQPLPVNDCCTCVSLFVSRILYFFSIVIIINWFELIWNVNHTFTIQTHIRSHMSTNTNHLRTNSFAYAFSTHRTTNDISQMTSTTFHINQNRVHMSFRSIQMYTQTFTFTFTYTHRLALADGRTHDECIQSINPFYFGFVSN